MTDEHAGTQLHDYGTYSKSAYLPEDAVLDFLGDQAASFDIEGLTDAYRTAINEQLVEVGISLHGKSFYSDRYPSVDDATERIEDAIRSVDLGDLAPQYDRECE